MKINCLHHLALPPHSQHMLLLLTAILAASSFSPSSSAQPAIKTIDSDPLPADVQAQLQRQAASMTKVSLDYKEPIAGGGLLASINFSANFDENQFRLRAEVGGLAASSKQIHEYSFDGQIFYNGEPEKTGGQITAMLTKYRADDESDPTRNIPLVGFDYLDWAGFYVPSSVAEMKGPLVNSLVLHHLQESSSNHLDTTGEQLAVTVTIPDPVLVLARATDVEQQRKDLATGRNSPASIKKQIEGLKEAQIMVPERVVRFFLDPKYQYAVVKREEWTADGRRILVIDSDHWKHYQLPDIWLPGRCVANFYANPELTEFSEKPSNVATAELQKIEFGSPKQVSYVLDYKKPGAVILDRTTPEALTNRGHVIKYVVSAKGDLFRHNARQALPEITHTRRTVTIIVLLVLSAIPLFWTMRRTKKTD